MGTNTLTIDSDDKNTVVRHESI